MDRREAEGNTLATTEGGGEASGGNMLAITDGGGEASGGGSSYVMLPSDRKAVAETRSSASETENEISVAKKNFDDKGWWGLWFDGKGFFTSSNKADVMEHMEKHRKFYETVVTFTVMVEKGDPKSYQTLLDIYEKLSVMEGEAKRDARSSKSKAVCRMLRDFLDEKYKLDHNLKRVECAVLRQKIDHVEQACQRSIRNVGKIGRDMEDLLEVNRRIQEDLRETKVRAEKSEAENRLCRSLVERLSAEKDELKEEMGRKMEELNAESDRRVDEMQRNFVAQMREMSEQNQRENRKRDEQSQRELRKITQMLTSMNSGSFP